MKGYTRLLHLQPTKAALSLFLAALIDFYFLFIVLKLNKSEIKNPPTDASRYFCHIVKIQVLVQTKSEPLKLGV